MINVDQAYNKVRKELADVGLLSEGFYLDHIEVCIASAPSAGEAGYLFEDGTGWKNAGYRPGVIYLPSDLPYHQCTPGATLADTIRHEYAHAWYCTDPEFFRHEWFIKTFGATYNNCNPKPRLSWQRQLNRNRRYQLARNRCRTEKGRSRLFDRVYRDTFITDYASSCACEDFAETFMFYLKYRNSLSRFENRPSVFRKLRTVERAVARASRRLHSVDSDQWSVRWA